MSTLMATNTHVQSHSSVHPDSPYVAMLQGYRFLVDSAAASDPDLSSDADVCVHTCVKLQITCLDSTDQLISGQAEHRAFCKKIHNQAAAAARTCCM